MPLDPDALAEAVRRTDGVTASFVRELVRRAVLAAAPDRPVRLDAATLGSILDELSAERSMLTTALLGGRSEHRS